MASKFVPGSFGNVIYSLEISFQDLEEVSGINHTTTARWADACQSGVRVVMRSSVETIHKIFDLINERDRERGGAGVYTPHQFGFFWPGQIRPEVATSDKAVQAEINRIHRRLATAGTQRKQLVAFSSIGRSSSSPTERCAFDLCWRRWCEDVFPAAPAIYRTPPQGVDWYCPQ